MEDSPFLDHDQWTVNLLQVCLHLQSRVTAAKIFQIIDHKPTVDRNSESGLELDSVSGQVGLKNVDFLYP
ncbi:hypothetical protein L6452_07176 [Arctium lappa]|uniref:Uncharacterized protein n=1 Tax=Arctium lappa TaxID=4217 RepID=A0ACB9EK14_ARCLA|nr:hypothetical protein L6452_07176 [Arctium lappa]